MDIAPDATSDDLLWPLGVAADGALEVRGDFQGYGGVPYDGLGELRYFQANFKRRP